YLSGRTQPRGDGIEHGAFAVAGNGRVFEDAAQGIAFLEQGFDAVQSRQRAPLLHRRRRGHRCRLRKPWLAAVLSAVVIIVRRQLRGKSADQYLVGIGIDRNLFAGQGDGQAGGVVGQFAAGLLGGGGDFLLGGQHHFANIFFGGFLAAAFLGFGFLFRGGLHL